MNQITVRPMTPADIDGVLAVEQASFAAPWSRRAFEAEMYDNDLARYLVLEDGGRIVGYAGAWLILDEAHVTNIAVHPTYRGRGLGKLLLNSLIQHMKAQGAASMTLEVKESNCVAQRLYTQLGFVVRGRREKYYTETNEDAIIMWLDL